MGRTHLYAVRAQHRGGYCRGAFSAAVDMLHRIMHSCKQTHTCMAPVRCRMGEGRGFPRGSQSDGISQVQQCPLPPLLLSDSQHRVAFQSWIQRRCCPCTRSASTCATLRPALLLRTLRHSGPALLPTPLPENGALPRLP